MRKNNNFKNIVNNKDIKDFSSSNIINYWQVMILHGMWPYQALKWAKSTSTRLFVAEVLVLQPDTFAIKGIGRYFEPLIRDDQAFCMCIAECDKSFEKEYDLTPIVEFLRLGDA
jgi:hypothetical protein